MTRKIDIVKLLSAEGLGVSGRDGFVFILMILLLMVFSVRLGLADPKTHATAWIGLTWLWVVVGGMITIRRSPLGVLAVGAGGGGKALSHLLLVSHLGVTRLVACCLRGLFVGLIAWRLYKLEKAYLVSMCALGLLFGLSVTI